MEGEKLRLFTAVTIPTPQLEWLDASTGDLRDVPGARWIHLDNQHVTLNFLGWVAADLFARVTAAVDEVATRHAPAIARIEGFGAFPRTRRARVLWAGIEDPDGLLPALAGDLGERFRPLGYEPEERPYTAHLTLARLKTPRAVELPPLPASDPFDVDRVALFRSRLSPAGARYEVVHEAYLTGTGRSQ